MNKLENRRHRVIKKLNGLLSSINDLSLSELDYLNFNLTNINNELLKNKILSSKCPKCGELGYIVNLNSCANEECNNYIF